MKILMIIALTVTIVQLPSAECVHPQYSFRCLEEGNIHLFGLNKSSTIISVSNCNINDVQSQDDYFLIPEKCLSQTRKVNIVVHDPNIDGPTTPAPTPLTSTTSPITTQYIGGFGTHSFTITCKNIPEEGINETVVHVFKGKEYNALPVNNMEVDDVEMRFKAVNDINSPDIASIYVGDEFFMFLEYMGEKNYSVIPKKCTANSGTIAGTSDVDLWNWDNADCSPNDELLKHFIKVSSKLIYAEMFGFRFSDSGYITIRCAVGIFPEKTNKKLCKNGNRRRRGIENVEVETKLAASKIRVYDNKDMYETENKSPQKSFDVSVWIFLVIGTLLNRW
ncbi:uncharacterized protein LOC128169664 [Crassostrea angulata]|uniref:uncharacterized protein LOC128169664 n=1 Tax=Magallana angulata TaxID=2784310 RepID=UPI0022B20500|nr:uncharacterized protein LOC128169664 [Crassostrea angulata]